MLVVVIVMVLVMIVVVALIVIVMSLLVVRCFRVERNAISTAQITVRQAHVTPIARCGCTKTMRCGRHVGIRECVHVAVLITMITAMILVMILVMVFVMVFVMVRTDDRALGNFIAFHINILVAIGQIQTT